MSRYSKAYSELLLLIEDWAAEFDLAKRPDLLATHVAQVVFEEFLMIDIEGVQDELAK